MQDDIGKAPKVAKEWINLGGRGYTLTDAQQRRKKKGKSIWNRDRKVEDYKFSKGEWV